MTDEAKDEIKSRMKHLARKFCRRNNVYEEFDNSVGKLIEKSYLSAYLLCLHESKNKIAELETQIEEMKCCGNCHYFNSDKNIGIGNLFCDLMLIKKEYCRNKDHWQFLRR